MSLVNSPGSPIGINAILQFVYFELYARFQLYLIHNSWFILEGRFCSLLGFNRHSPDQGIVEFVIPSHLGDNSIYFFFFLSTRRGFPQIPTSSLTDASLVLFLKQPLSRPFPPPGKILKDNLFQFSLKIKVFEFRSAILGVTSGWFFQVSISSSTSASHRLIYFLNSEMFRLSVNFLLEPGFESLEFGVMDLIKKLTTSFHFFRLGEEIKANQLLKEKNKIIIGF